MMTCSRGHDLKIEDNFLYLTMPDRFDMPQERYCLQCIRGLLASCLVTETPDSDNAAQGNA